MQSNGNERLNAGFFVRLAAFLLDSLIVWVALLIVRVPIWISSIANPDNIVVRDLVFSYSIADIVYYVLGVMYFIILTYKTGATIGKRVLHLKVVSTENRDLTLWEVMFRETVGRFLSALVADAGYIMIGIHKKKQGLHDLMSDTEVIYYHEKSVYVDAEVHVKETGTNDYVTPSYVHDAVQNIETVETVEVAENIEKEPE